MPALSALDNPAIVSIQTAVRRYNQNLAFVILGFILLVGLGYVLYKFYSTPKQAENFSRDLERRMAAFANPPFNRELDGKKDSTDDKA